MKYSAIREVVNELKSAVSLIRLCGLLVLKLDHVLRVLSIIFIRIIYEGAGADDLRFQPTFEIVSNWIRLTALSSHFICSSYYFQLVS